MGNELCLLWRKNEFITKSDRRYYLQKKNFPENAFQVISDNKEEAIPYLRAAIEKAIEERDDLDEDYQLHFYGIYLLGQFQDKEFFPKMMELITLPSEVLDYLIGDAITSNLQDLIYNMYNGELEHLKSVVRDINVDDFVRAGLLRVMAQLYLDGAFDKKEWQEFLKFIVYDEEDIGEYIYTELADIICRCHFVDMLPEVQQLYKSGRIDIFVIGKYDSCVDSMFQYEDDDSDFCKSPINAADLLRGWAMFEDSPVKNMDHKDWEQLFHAAEKENLKPEPKVKIGRNAPCPCGSGKKYKQCCLNKPKTAVDLIESEQEKRI